MSAEKLAIYIMGYLQKHEDGEAHLYLHNNQGSLDEVIATSKTMFMPLGPGFILIKNAKDNDMTFIRNVTELSEVVLVPGNDNIPVPASSPAPAVPGAPVQVG